jgi:hypothetical protein
VSTFAKYLATAHRDQKGALTGFFQFVMRLTMTIGMGIYVLVADRLPVRALPIIPIILLTASIFMLLFKKRSFQSA